MANLIKEEILNEKRKLYIKLIEANPNCEVKGKNMLYTSVNGHMFSYIGKDHGVGLRLPKEVREKFLANYNVELSIQYNTVMKEYVDIPLDLLKKTKILTKYLQISYDYVSSLKPKPTKKKKS